MKTSILASAHWQTPITIPNALSDRHYISYPKRQRSAFPKQLTHPLRGHSLILNNCTRKDSHGSCNGDIYQQRLIKNN